jgi:hypothetical protein
VVSRGIKLWVAVLPLVAAALVASSASACRCTEFCGRVVAHGSSLYGVPWRITAATLPATAHQGATAEIHFSIGACGEYSEAGYSSSLELPLPRQPFVSADRGSDLDDYPESDLSGLTSRGVTELVLRMSDGTTMSVEPQLAPRSLWRLMPWLRGLRFFDVFYTAGVEAIEVDAYDRTGRLLGGTRANHGLFHWYG